MKAKHSRSQTAENDKSSSRTSARRISTRVESTREYPEPVIEHHEGFYVVRDDLLKYGSKIRFLDELIRISPHFDFVCGSSNKVGWGAISLAYVCKKYQRRAICFMAKRSELTSHQQQFRELGGEIRWVANGMLPVTQKAARDFVARNPQRRSLLPMGMDHPSVHAAIAEVARALPIKPREIWTVASSGTLTRGLQSAFPSAKVFAVQIGHKLSESEAGRAEIFVSPYRYDQPVKAPDRPPYPSEPYYDAKVWSFVKRYGSKGALIWNVA